MTVFNGLKVREKGARRCLCCSRAGVAGEAVQKGIEQRKIHPLHVPFCGHIQVKTSQGHEGVIEGSFGKSGKFKVAFNNGAPSDSSSSPEDRQLMLRFKRFVFEPDKKRRPRQC